MYTAQDSYAKLHLLHTPDPVQFSTDRAGAAAGAEKHASQVPLHQEPYLRSMLSIITAVSVKTVQRLSATYAAFKESAWHTWITIRSTEEATTGAGALLSIQQ